MITQIAIDETLLNQALQVTRARSGREVVENALRLLIKSRRPKKLSDFLRQSPLAEVELDLTRSRDTGRDIEL